MADEAKKKPEAAAGSQPEKREAAATTGSAAAGAAAKGALLTKTPVLLGGAMVLEALVLFAGFKFLGGSARPAAGAELSAEEPAAAETATEGSASASTHGGSGSHGSASEHGAAGAAPTKIDRKKTVEVKVLDFRAPNKQSGRTFLYDVTIVAVTKSEYKDRVETTIKEREALITDRVRTIIAQSDPEKLGGGSLEPGLETLRRQVKYQLDEIVGDGVIDEVLVPRCIPFRTDY